VEREVLHLRATKADVAAGSNQQPGAPRTTGSGLAWSLPGPTTNAGQGNATPATGTTDEVATLKHRVSMLEKKVSDLEDQAGGETIIVAGAEFSSLAEAGAWLRLHAPNNGDYAFFLDAHGLMALAYGRGTTTQEVLKMDRSNEGLS
jgi:hypothetical protein